MRHILYDRACGNVPGTHGRQLTCEPWQGHGGELVQDEMDMAGQGSVVDLVGAVVERLERLRVEQAHQKVEAVVIVRDHRVQRALLLSQGIKIHIVTIRNGLDLG